MTADILGCFMSPSLGVTEDMEEAPLEVNYDSVELTYLYQAIEDKAFMAAIDFLESGKPEVATEVRTWVTRYEKAVPGKIRWSQLPLHAALVFKAPIKVIQLLVKQFPKAVRCTNDQSMLPLHLAFRHGASDNTLHLLMKEFPEAINAKDYRGRDPLAYAPMGDSWKKGEIINMYLEKKSVVAEPSSEPATPNSEISRGFRTDESAATAAATAKVLELEKQNEELVASATHSKREVSKLQEEVNALKEEKAEKEKAEKLEAERKAAEQKEVAIEDDSGRKKKGLKRVFKGMFKPKTKA
uniref:Uncharacterized protein n=1 Tax=Cyclophora tenuis TaxID=216820 RepID=A0A7S1DBZ3_CYCTE|mmetsp:Transcript_8767/g.14750  ORF Transcript_8767/g.14750 Transcript_8767/m.14750 type:complete len:298 (+) Transcript_8767:85-978(+)